MRAKPEPRDVTIVLLGRGVGFVWVTVAALLMATPWANGAGGGASDLLSPGFSPAGVLRAALLLPVSLGLATAEAMDAAGLAVDVRVAVLFGVGVPVGVGGLGGSLVTWRLRR